MARWCSWLALCSPFGFHFGRLLGWYSVALLLVAALSYCYARWLEEGAPAWAAATLLLAAALLYTNYFAWALVGLLALDAALFRRTSRLRALLEAAGALLLLVMIFAPLWPAFHYLQQHPLAKVEGSKLAAYIFDMYALLVSESFAPWFFAVGVPVALLCAVCFVLTLLMTRGLPRRFYVYFLVLTATLALIGSINTKRLPFLTGWLFLPIAVAIAQSGMPRLRRVLVASMAIVFAVGWFGTLHGGYYASTHFVDDWKDAVALAMHEHAAGGALLYDQRVGSYYLDRALHLARDIAPWRIVQPAERRRRRRGSHIVIRQSGLSLCGVCNIDWQGMPAIDTSKSIAGWNASNTSLAIPRPH